MKKITAAFLLLVALFQAADASDNLDNCKKSFILPIDHSNHPRKSLVVDIPQNYKSIQPFSTWDKIAVIEFIPVDDSVNHWSEIIGAKYLSGPYDCVGVPYTIRLKKGKDEQQEALKKTNAFFEKNLKVIEN